MSEEYNLGPGLGNVVCGLMRKLRYAGHQLEERERTIINVSTYEVTAALWALQEYARRNDLMEVSDEQRRLDRHYSGGN